MEERIARTVIKVRGGTARSQHICLTCAHFNRRRGVSGAEDVQLCGHYAFEGHELITGPVAECSQYYNKSLPNLKGMEDIAWDIETIRSGSKRTVGFVSPEERRRRNPEPPQRPRGV